MNTLILLNSEDCLEVFLILLIEVWYRNMYRIVNGVSRYVSYREVVYRCIPIQKFILPPLKVYLTSFKSLSYLFQKFI